MGQSSSKPDGREDSTDDDFESRSPFTETQILCGHSDIVRVILKIDNRRLASGSDDHSIIIWNYETGEIIGSLSGHSKPVTCLLSLDQNLLASGSSDRSVKIWDLDSGQCIQTLRAHEGSVKCLVKLGEGRFCSGANDQKLIVWDFNGRMLAVMERNEEDNILALLPISKNRLVVASNSKYLLVYDVTTQTQTEILDFHRESVQCLIHISDDLFASASLDGAIHVWSTETLTPVRTLNYHDEFGDGQHASYLYRVHHLAVLKERYLAAAINNGFSIYDLDSGECVSACRDAHEATVLALTPLADESLIASCSADFTVRIWQALKPINSSDIHLYTNNSVAPTPGKNYPTTTNFVPFGTPLPQTPYAAYQTPQETAAPASRSSENFPGTNLEKALESEFRRMTSSSRDPKRTLLSAAVAAAAASGNLGNNGISPRDLIVASSTPSETQSDDSSATSTPATALHRSLLVPDMESGSTTGGSEDSPNLIGPLPTFTLTTNRRTRSLSSLSDSSLPDFFTPLAGSFRSSETSSPFVTAFPSPDIGPSGTPDSPQHQARSHHHPLRLRQHLHYRPSSQHHSRKAGILDSSPSSPPPSERPTSRSLPTPSYFDFAFSKSVNKPTPIGKRAAVGNGGGSGDIPSHQLFASVEDQNRQQRRTHFPSELRSDSETPSPEFRPLRTSSSLPATTTTSRSQLTGISKLKSGSAVVDSGSSTPRDPGSILMSDISISENHFRTGNTPRGHVPHDPLSPPPSNPVLKQPDKTFMAKQGWLSGLFGFGQRKAPSKRSGGLFSPLLIANLGVHADVVHSLVTLDDTSIASCGADGLVVLFKNGRVESYKRSLVSRDALMLSMLEHHREAIALGHFSWLHPRYIVQQQLLREYGGSRAAGSSGGPTSGGAPSPLNLGGGKAEERPSTPTIGAGNGLNEEGPSTPSDQLQREGEEDSDDPSSSDFMTPRLRFVGAPGDTLPTKTKRRRLKPRRAKAMQMISEGSFEGGENDSVEAQAVGAEDLCDTDEEEERSKRRASTDQETSGMGPSDDESLNSDEFEESRTASATPFST